MNAVIYARYSTGAHQTERSIEGQLRVCYDYAKREGLQIVSEYIDRALTGRNDDRPEFQRMLSDAKHKQFERVLVYKLDRFARNLYDFVIHEHTLKKYGITVISAMEGIDDRPESIMLKALLAASAEYYSHELSQKVKRGRHDSALKGKFVGGTVPMGYKFVGGALVLDELTVPHMKWAFEQYAAGMSRKQIIDELNRRGLRNHRGNPLTKSALYGSFRSRKFIGVLEQSGVSIDGGCPALVDKETFDKVQEWIGIVKRAPAASKAKIEYLLSGKLYCGMCGSLMTGGYGTSRTGNKYSYYVCSNRKNGHRCKKRNERQGFLEWYVVSQTVEYVLTPPRIDIVADAIISEYENQFGVKQIRDVEARLTRIDADINKYVESILKMPKSAHGVIRSNLERLDAMKIDLEIDLAKLRTANNIQYTRDEVKAWLNQFCKGDPLDEEFRRRIIDVFVNCVYLYDDKVVIFYNIKGGKQVSYIDLIDALEEPDPDEARESGSDMIDLAPPKNRGKWRVFLGLALPGERF